MRKTDNSKNLHSIALVFIVLVIFIVAFIIKYNTSSENGSKLLNIFSPSYDISYNKKSFGSSDVRKDDRENIYVKLSSGISKLDSVVDKVVTDYLTSATTYNKYTIDYKSDIYFDNIYKVNYMLLNGDKPNSEVVKSISIYYAKNMDKIVGAEDILRHNYEAIAKYRYKDISFDGIDISNFDLYSDKIIFGKDKKLEVKYDDYKYLFNAELGVPSIYTGGQVKKQNIIPIDPNKKHIAFTFDDGPANENHVKIRELFDKYNQQASFFFVGNMVKVNSQMVKDTYEKGHLIANHSFSHPDLVKLTPAKQAQEIMDTSDLILQNTGYDPVFLRPPYGSFNQTTKDIFQGEMALWNVDSLDWQNRNTQAIINEVKPYVQDGAIVLFHDLYDTSYEAVKILIPQLINEGYQFVRYDVMIDYLHNKYNKEKNKE